MNRCPSPHELKKLLDESSNDDAQRATQKHVKSCVSCQRTLSDLSDETDVAKWRRRLQKNGRALEVEERLHLQ